MLRRWWSSSTVRTHRVRESDGTSLYRSSQFFAQFLIGSRQWRNNAVNAEIAGNAGLSDDASGVSDDRAKSENDQSQVTHRFCLPPPRFPELGYFSRSPCSQAV